jgi:hypothetical protein
MNRKQTTYTEGQQIRLQIQRGNIYGSIYLIDKGQHIRLQIQRGNIYGGMYAEGSIYLLCNYTSESDIENPARNY